MEFAAAPGYEARRHFPQFAARSARTRLKSAPHALSAARIEVKLRGWRVESRDRPKWADAGLATVRLKAPCDKSHLLDHGLADRICTHCCCHMKVTGCAPARRHGSSCWSCGVLYEQHLASSGGVERSLPNALPQWHLFQPAAWIVALRSGKKTHLEPSVFTLANTFVRYARIFCRKQRMVFVKSLNGTVRIS